MPDALEESKSEYKPNSTALVKHVKKIMERQDELERRLSLMEQKLSDLAELFKDEFGEDVFEEQNEENENK